ncbi:heavy metal translocating P-type ATPase metal-binding domain-containing protein [Stella sp.]|uniref:heavy metal translocating P-type ATPase metal-binding domain-containing protein n=1 Tax=Stella sp. TaxID=2912054 RepID=UPI0035B2DEA6
MIPEPAREAAPAAGAAAACRHCGQPLPAGAAGEFCCTGCAAARQTIEGLGLDRFYDRFVLDPAMAPLKPAADATLDATAYAEAIEGGRSRVHLMVDGLHCAACVWLIEGTLARDPRVLRARVNMTTRRLVVEWRGPPALADAVLAPLVRLGFTLAPYDPGRMADAAAQTERRLLQSMAVAGFAAANVMLLSVAVWSGLVGREAGGGMGVATRDLLHWISAAIALPAIAYAGLTFFEGAWRALRAGRSAMDVPIAVGVTLAAAASLYETIHSGTHAYFDSAVTLLFFLLIGRWLDQRARGRARSAAQHLLGLGARAVSLLRPDGTTERRVPEAVRPGDRVLVAAGERIGVDGRVAAGQSDVDTALVSGESVPVAVRPGSLVHAGTVNLTAPLTLVTTASGEGTLLAEIVRLMEAAEQGRARLVALADRVARIYAPVVHVAALATFLGWWLLLAAPWQTAMMHAVAVLIITCPCALGLAVPVVQVVTGGRLMRRGVLLKSATALERLAQVDTVVFDKTGTLTEGRPALLPDAGRSPADLEAAAGLAASSRHPLAQALVAAVGRPVAAAADVVEHPSRGLSWAGPAGEWRLGSRAFCGVGEAVLETDPELFLVRPGRAPVRFAFRDALRPDAANTVRRLRERGLAVRLLSGDRAPAVARAAAEAGIGEWQSGLDPAGKVAALAALAAAGQRVLMVGDGLNDAPALAAAHVSMAPAAAADVSQSAADLVFQGGRLAPVADALDAAATAGVRIRENLVLAIGYNALAVPLAVLGHVTPLVAAVAMSSSSILVIGNALRRGRR